MKTKLIIVVFLAALIGINAEAQITNPFKKSNQVVNEIEKYRKKDKKSKQKQKAEDESTDKQTEGQQTETGSQESQKIWTKYDFVPGDIIIFQDNQDNEENGEFPSRWDLKEGNVEIAMIGDDYVINFASTLPCIIVPLMKEKGDYLPEKFTIEFDAYFSEFCTRYYVYLYDIISQEPIYPNPFILISPDELHVEGFSGTNWGGLGQSDYPFWQHISISFNVRALKVYHGERRGINIPNLRAEPTGITIKSGQCHQGNHALIKNIRIAQGSKTLYDRVVTDGKFVTTGIRFNSGKATIKPESAGTLKKIYNLMEEHPDLRFSVEGHTDNVGEDDFNHKLSEKRAESVKDELVSRGISADRLQTKGWGESKPIQDNSTPEGRANNRRVEFVKL